MTLYNYNIRYPQFPHSYVDTFFVLFNKNIYIIMRTCKGMTAPSLAILLAKKLIKQLKKGVGSYPYRSYDIKFIIHMHYFWNTGYRSLFFNDLFLFFLRPPVVIVPIMVLKNKKKRGPLKKKMGSDP